MKTWIISTLIIGSICYYGASKASKAVQKRTNAEYNVLVQHNDTITTLTDYLKSELGE